MASRTRSTLGAVAMFAAGGAAAVLLAGCGSSGPAGSAASGSHQQAVQVMRELSRCIRAHGLPDFPDPTVGGDGTPSLPDSAPRVPTAARRACAQIAARLPAQYTSTQAVSTADFQKLLVFARCMRSHGVPDWPDPNSLGEFPLDPHLLADGKRFAAAAAHACARLNPNPNGGINVVRAP